jgi:sugar lactone lactonase YvrE
MGEVDVRPVVRAQASPGEGPSWDATGGVLWWVDIDNHMVHRYDPVADTDIAIDVGMPVGAAVPRKEGGLLLAVPDGFATLDPDKGDVEPIAVVEADLPGNRMNDAKADAAGRVWAGTMPLPVDPMLGYAARSRNSGALYCLESDRTVRRVLTDVGISNGLSWSPDNKTLYYIDSLAFGVDAFDFELSAGALSNRRRLITFAEWEGFPDGLTVDSEGCIWVALFRSWVLRRFNPDGSLERQIELPAPAATSCCFGGPDLCDLYITTYRSPDAPMGSLAGSLLRCQPGITGLPTHSFKDRAGRVRGSSLPSRGDDAQ